MHARLLWRLLVGLVVVPPLAAAEPASLESKLLPLIAAHKGDVAVAVKHLDTGEAYQYHADEPMPTASLIKLPVMVEVYRQAAERKVDLDQKVTLRQEDKVPGSGILTNHFSPGATFPLRDAVHLMIVYSDNTATNLVLDVIGIKATADTMERLGYPNTKIHSKVFKASTTTVFPERSKQFGLGSTTANEMVRLCEALWRKELVDPPACAAMLAHLRACEDKNKFTRFLPAETKLAFKTGDLTEAKTAAGIIECPAGPVAVCVLTNRNADKRWVTDNAGNRLCADVAQAVYDHFSGAKHPAAAESR